MQKILFSIVIPIYNVEQYLDRCIQSVLSQNYSNYEIILVNDGSTDTSLAICNRYYQLYPHKIKLINKQNEGLSYARRDGFKQAMGDYTLFIDSDDYISKDYLTNSYKQIMDNNLDILLPNIILHYSDHNQVFFTDLKEDIVYTSFDILKKIVLNIVLKDYVWGKIYRTSLIKLHYFSRTQIFEDVCFTYRIVKNSKRIAFSNHIDYFYVQRENSILTSCFNEKKLVLLDNVKEMYDDLIKLNILNHELHYRWIKTNIMLFVSMTTIKTNMSVKMNEYYKSVIYEMKKADFGNKYFTFKDKIILSLVKLHLSQLLVFYYRFMQNKDI